MSLFYNPKIDGKGVKKDNNKGFSNCLRIFFEKLKDIILINLLFVLTLLPFFAASIFIAYAVFPDTNILSNLNIQFTFQIMLIPLPFAFCGPLVAALTKLTRDIGREEHIFIIKDYFETAKRCWKQGILFSFLAYVFYISAFFALLVYSGTWILFGAATLCTIYITIMFKYIFLMIVSLKLKPSKLIKNGFLLILASVKKSASGLLVLFINISMVAFYLIGAAQNSVVLLLFAISAILVLFAVPSYFENYYYFQAIIEKVVDPYYENLNNNETIDIKEDKLEKYNNKDNITEKSDYVYKDGKLIRKNLIEQESLFNDN